MFAQVALIAAGITKAETHIHLALGWMRADDKAGPQSLRNALIFTHPETLTLPQSIASLNTKAAPLASPPMDT